MIKKRLLYISLTALIACTEYGMVTEIEQIANSPIVQTIETDAKNFISSSVGETIIKDIENFIEPKIEAIFSHSTATTATTTTTSVAAKTKTTTTTSTGKKHTTTPTIPTVVVSDPAAHAVIAQNNAVLNQPNLSTSQSIANDTQEQVPLSKSNQHARDQVPHLNLNSASLSPVRTASVSLQPKTPVKNTHQLSKAANQKLSQTARSSRNTPSVSSNAKDVIINMDETDNTQKMYSEERVWQLMKAWDPSVYAFAQKKNLSIEEAEEVGILKREIEVEPEAVVDYVNKNKLSDNKTSVISPEKYKKKVQGEKSEEYKQIVLELLLDVVKEESGKISSSSALDDTHINLLEDQVVAEQQSKNNWQIVAIVKLVVLGGTSVATLIWAIYNQVHGTATAAPTMAPTFAPTFAPI